MDMHQGDKRPQGQPAALLQAFVEWMIAFLRSVGALVTDNRADGGHGLGSGADGLEARGSREVTAGGSTPFPMQKSVAGYISGGIRKMQRVRYSAALHGEYTRIQTTIRLTRRAIKSAPRSSRYLFEGYARLLNEATGKVESLYRHAQLADEHLWRYDPRGLEEEIGQLESYRRRGSSPATIGETEASIEARRELLNSIRMMEETLSTSAAQLRFISASLELNHMRIVTIATRAGRPGETDSELLRDRMQELTEQLALLDESIRELDRI
jgi:hypothetical protein